MSYINNITGTLSGPLQIQKNGPWISYINSNFTIKTYEKETIIPTNLLIKTPSFASNQWNPNTIPNIEWIQAYVQNVVTGGGDPIDLSKYVQHSEFDLLVKEVETIIGDLPSLQKNLQDITDRVIIIEEWRSTLVEKEWIIDGCDPSGMPRYFEKGDI